MVLVGEDEVATGAEIGDEGAVSGESGEDDAVGDVGVEVYEGVGLGGAEGVTRGNERPMNGCCRAEGRRQRAEGRGMDSPDMHNLVESMVHGWEVAGAKHVCDFCEGGDLNE